MMQPKKTKFRKAHKGRIHGVATSGATLSFGRFGLKAMAPSASPHVRSKPPAAR